MKYTFTQFCCGLLCFASALALAERLRAEDASDTEGVVRTISFADDVDDAGTATTGQSSGETGTAFTGQTNNPPPVYSESNVDQVFQPSLQYKRRNNRRLLPRHPNGPMWDAYTAWSVKPGNRRVMGDGQIVVPLWQNSTSMLFADVRGQVDDSGSYEGNWGVGFRQIRDNRWILGAYGFYDRRKTETGNYFSQGTFGIEAMSVEWEARANVYLPDSRPLEIAGSATAPRALIFNNRAVIRTGRNSLEQALYGVDFEVGKLFYEWGPDIELRGFLTAFHFDTENQGFTNVTGARGRAELRIYDLNFLGEGSRINIGAEYQYDEIRASQATAMLRVQIPLGRKRPVQTRLQRRMMDRIVRDVDIVSTNKTQRSVDEEALDVLTGRSFGRIDLVDGTTPDVASAVQLNAASNPGGPSTVIVSDRAGQVRFTSTVDLRPFQNIIGSGYRQRVIGAVTGRTLILTIPGSRPDIVAQTTATTPVVINAINLEDDTTVRGLGISVAVDAIRGTTINRAVIDQNIITGAGVTGSGLRVITSFSGNVTGNNVDGVGLDGLWIDTLDVDGLFNGIAGGRFSGNLVENNGTDGIHIDGFALGAFIINNESNFNGLSGYLVTPLPPLGTAFNNIGISNVGGNNTFP